MPDPVEVPGGVTFRGPIALGLRATLWSRIAMRVLMSIGSGPAEGPNPLYASTRALPLLQWFTPRHTISVHARVADVALSHSKYAALKVKDAIVDTLRDRFGSRPSVAPDPDIDVVVHVRDGVAYFYLDLAGAPLNQRGYRRRDVEAPLKENVAAALLRYSGWDGRAPLHDPTCGSGTIAIEAASIATDLAPGLSRGFRFERWPHFAALEATWTALRAEAQERRRPQLRGAIVASDRDPKAVAATRTNLGVAGFQGVIVRQADARDVAPLLGGGYFVFNPPYGERIGGSDEAVGKLYDALGERMMSTPGHTAALITTASALRGHFAPRPVRVARVLNGPLRCEMAVFASSVSQATHADAPASDDAHDSVDAIEATEAAES